MNTVNNDCIGFKDCFIDNSKMQGTHLDSNCGMLEMVVVLSSGRTRLISNVAFLSGRSKQGNARLASIGENCVLANDL